MAKFLFSFSPLKCSGSFFTWVFVSILAFTFTRTAHIVGPLSNTIISDSPKSKAEFRFKILASHTFVECRGIIWKMISKRISVVLRMFCSSVRLFILKCSLCIHIDSIWNGKQTRKIHLTLNDTVPCCTINYIFLCNIHSVGTDPTEHTQIGCLRKRNYYYWRSLSIAVYYAKSPESCIRNRTNKKLIFNRN